MAAQYANIIDVAKIAELVGTSYANDAKLVASGIVAYEGTIGQGTNYEWIREKLFEGDTSGQVLGVGTELTLKARVQTKYAAPVVTRGDAAEFDAIEEEISDAVVKGIKTRVAEAVRMKSAQMIDDVYINILNGIALKQENATENYLDTVAAQITPALIQQAKSKREDKGMFQNGVMVAKSLVIHKLLALGGVAFTSNTVGIKFQDEWMSNGTIGNVLGMGYVMDDKVGATSDTDYFVYLLERGALAAKSFGQPVVYPFTKIARRAAEELLFYVKAAGTVRGMSYGGGLSDKISNADLATLGNWSRGAAYAKDVPMVTMRIPAPTF